jgi:large subunit ribosomal protein L3
MGHRSGPRRGSLAFYPKKRAKKIFATAKHFRGEGLLGFAGYKAGMTHVLAMDNYEKSPSYGMLVHIPCTIIETPDLFCFGAVAYKKTPYGLSSVSTVYADKLDKELARILLIPKKHNREENKKKIEKELDSIAEIRLLVHTQPKRVKLKKKPEVFELPILKPAPEAWKMALERIGTEIKVSEILKEGDYVDTTAITKGKGVAGPVKRFGMKMQVHKATPHRRRPGAIGGWHPARVLYTTLQQGQLGFQRRTEPNKRVLKIGSNAKEINPKGGIPNYGEITGNYVLIKGSVPGPKKRLIFIRKALRQIKETPLPAIQVISTKPQQ